MADKSAIKRVAKTPGTKKSGGSPDPRNANRDGEAAVLAAVQKKIASMAAPYDAMATRLHALILRSAPELEPTLWYGMPAYRKNGNVICLFRADKYMTFGLSDKANHTLEDDAQHQLRESAWFFDAMDEPTEDKLSAIVRKAAS